MQITDQVLIGVIIGLISAFVIWIVLTLFFKFINRNKNKEYERPKLPTLKSYVKKAHNDLVDAADNLSKLYSVFNDIEGK